MIFYTEEMDPATTKTIAFSTFVFLSAGHALASGYSRKVLHESFDINSIIILSEMAKFMVSTAICLMVEKISTDEYLLNLTTKSWPMAVPAFLYFFQNNLYYLELQLVSPAVYITLSQLKVLVTAIFAVIFLRQTVTKDQWRALVVLTVGAMLVQSQSADFSSSSKLGLILIVIHCCSSAMAGIYFEKYLKQSSNQSVWQRNVQLSLYSLLFAILSRIFVQPIAEERSFLDGFSALTWLLVVFSTINGLVIAFLIKTADNIVKNFGTTLSVVVTSVCDYLLLGSSLAFNFWLGVVLILLSVSIYRDGAQPAVHEERDVDDIEFSPLAKTSDRDEPI